MLEATLTKRVTKFLRSVPFLHVSKYHGTNFSRAGMPDLLVRWRSHDWSRSVTIWIELKVEGGRLSKIQKAKLIELKNYYDGAHVAYSLEEVKGILRFYRIPIERSDKQ